MLGESSSGFLLGRPLLPGLALEGVLTLLLLPPVGSVPEESETESDNSSSENESSISDKIEILRTTRPLDVRTSESVLRSGDWAAACCLKAASLLRRSSLRWRSRVRCSRSRSESRGRPGPTLFWFSIFLISPIIGREINSRFFRVVAENRERKSDPLTGPTIGGLGEGRSSNRMPRESQRIPPLASPSTPEGKGS